MKNGRCPYLVKQGIVNEQGQLVLSSICGMRSAAGDNCSFADETAEHKSCPRYKAQQIGGERQIVMPRQDIEYLPDLGGVASISEMELM